MSDRSFEPPQRTLLGPGPSNVHPKVLAALSQPLVGHLDPSFLALMDTMRERLQRVFRTENELTFAVSGTGSAGMEACLANLLEEGDEALVCVNGVFGTRMVDIVERLRAKPRVIELEWGRAVDPDRVRRALAEARPPKLVAVVHAETSTGAWSPVADVAKIAHEAGALVLVDAVTSLGGCPVEIDAWGIDACYSGTQKCLSCPPGLAPVTFGPRAVETIRARRTKVASWYLDATMIGRYWGSERVYHHTAPISMSYALAEALRLVLEEGLEARFRRHERHHRALVVGLEMLGFRFLVPAKERLWMLNSVIPPVGLDEAKARTRLLEDYGIEVGGGLGPLKGKVWRIGLMGESSRRANVVALFAALEDILGSAGIGVREGAAALAAQEHFASEA